MFSAPHISGNGTGNDVFALWEINVSVLDKQVESNDVNFILVRSTDNSSRIQKNSHVSTHHLSASGGVGTTSYF